MTLLVYKELCFIPSTSYSSMLRIIIRQFTSRSHKPLSLCWAMLAYCNDFETTVTAKIRYSQDSLSATPHAVSCKLSVKPLKMH
jgi:hypothetical protein